ncbi:MAG: toprim domain-containing protein, partial [Chloroflexota bacterium]
MAGWGFADGCTGLRDYLEQAGADIAPPAPSGVTIARTTGLVRKDGRDFTANRDGDVASPFGWLVYTHRPYANARRKKCEQCEAETWHYENRCLQHELVTVPLNGVTYFSARAIVPAGKDKSRNLPGDRQLYKAEVPTVREVIICEGPADAESYRLLGFTAWALCGLGHLPEDDLRQLQKRPAVYLALDNDEAGLKNQAKLARELGPLSLLMPPIEGFKDANDFLQKSGDAGLITRQLEDSQAFL